MTTVFFCSNLDLRLYDFNFNVMGKKYILSLLCATLVLGNRVKSSKITSYFELFWTKHFPFDWQNVSTLFQYVCQDWLTDYPKIYWALTLQKHVPKELSLQMMKNSEYSNSNLPN